MRWKSRILQYAPIARTVYFGLYRLAVRARCWYADKKLLPADRTSDPIPPAILRFRIGETTDLSSFFAIGHNTLKSLEAALASVSRPIDSFQSILDFGCGCGRTLIWLAKQYPQLNLYGTDVDKAAIAWCNTHISS